MRRVLIAATIMLLLLPVSAQARQRHRHHGYICGLTQARYFHLPARYALALNYADLPHTDPHPGAVVVQRRKGRALGGGPGGHVSRIVENISQCVARVTDEKGTYTRDICKNLVAYVQP